MSNLDTLQLMTGFSGADEADKKILGSGGCASGASEYFPSPCANALAMALSKRALAKTLAAALAKVLAKALTRTLARALALPLAKALAAGLAFKRLMTACFRTVAL